MNKPTQIQDPDLTKLRESCQDYIDSLEDGSMNDDNREDYDNAVFEAAMFALFGKGVFQWINKDVFELVNRVDGH